ncbi:hypothetical protein QPK87_37425 [Kamptonema cortianum]|nr:hypothetical protein [Geitlerinema splendidum]MDK3162189.1 hypothetical protein [Kamptonema cortianum]
MKHVELKSDQPVTSETCKSATGASLEEWFARLDSQPELAKKRRDAINWLYQEMGKDAWWSTTAWVEYEASKGIVQKDGLAEGYNICVTKSVAAPLSDVYTAVKADLMSNDQAELIRDREDKDLRYTWNTKGVDTATAADVAVSLTGNKTGIIVNHKRIQTRAEADGLRNAWGEYLAELKAKLEK